MASYVDVALIANALPEVSEGPHFGNRAWKVRAKTFVWERPLGKKDVDELGDAAPPDPILGARTADIDEQRALVEGEGDYCFITTHFSGYPAVLIRLDRIPQQRLREIITDAWLVQAPKGLAKEFLQRATSRP